MREKERCQEQVEQDLINTFNSTFEREGVEIGLINLHLKSTRDKILENVPESPLERNYIDKNYEKILNRIKTIYENDKQSRESIEKIKMQPIIEKERKRQEHKNIAINLLLLLGKAIKWTFILTVGLIFLIFKFISDLSKK